MADRWRGVPSFDDHDEVDEYLRNEYRAEQGAYVERRPDYARTGAGERDPRFWGPRLPLDYRYDPDLARAGTGAALDEPLYRSDETYRRPGSSWRGYDEEWMRRRDNEERMRRQDRSRRTFQPDRRNPDPWRRDREAGHGLMRAAEHFFEDITDDLAPRAGPEQGDPRRHHRGRGPRNYTRSDERIREDVNDRLTDDPHVDASEIEVTVSNREVTLSGTVSNRFEKRHAEDLAESVSGVTHVQNNLRVKPQVG